MSGRLTTHVLDVSQGTPASGMRVQLRRLAADGAWQMLKEIFTNEDGRYHEPLLAGEAMAAGTYELLFDVGEYYRGSAPISFLEWVPVRFHLADPASHYHVPLLVAPGGYSTYRGS
ncbi:hydroxyisourate hydrolase [Cohnella lubricantis]|uniref:5-hydroxyisourate hydrolase n=1 Tax=Cohnella lubricantis TaxID=2163172 RepID=A0A841TAE1_9BACL|nr:hydroxyisourate hydrolase [Cohnella lubricantis]MBB6676995.1 hydroxyisourate hydrolase [Cohnella lubricantis]MBP2117053.1 5-hydroxyisourate hydrolase [Cohnella lubricantis]